MINSLQGAATPQHARGQAIEHVWFCIRISAFGKFGQGGRLGASWHSSCPPMVVNIKAFIWEWGSASCVTKSALLGSTPPILIQNHNVVADENAFSERILLLHACPLTPVQASLFDLNTSGSATQPICTYTDQVESCHPNEDDPSVMTPA